MEQKDVNRCSVEITLDVIGGKWKGVILFHLMNAKEIRFNQFVRHYTTHANEAVKRT